MHLVEPNVSSIYSAHLSHILEGSYVYNDPDSLIQSVGRIPKHRPPDKSVYWKSFFFISDPKHMLWVLKRTVSMRWFF